MQPLLVVTAPLGAGKHRVARLLTVRFDRGVHVQCDAFFDLVVCGAIIAPLEQGFLSNPEPAR